MFSSDAEMRRPRATTPLQRLEAELAAVRAENVRLRRRLAAHEAAAVEPAPLLPGPQRDLAAHVRTMLRDSCSRNP
jgi:hypothetical protein